MKNNWFVKIAFIGALITLGISSITLSNNYNLDNIQQVEAFSGSQTPTYSSNYYDACEGLTGDDLLEALASFNQPQSKSYDWSRYEEADEAEGYDDKVICLYSRELFDKSAHVSNSYSSTTWNREHIYTQSAFSEASTDNHNVFACEGEINNIRGNKKFAEVEHTTSNRVSTYGVETDCYTTSSYFEPCDEAKGEVARAVMYCAVYYGYDITDIFDSVETCLSWHNLYGVTDRDIYRNNTVYTNQGNRNPFVDHPEYANYIWGSDNPMIVLAANLSLQVGEVYTLNGYVNLNSAISISYTSSNSNVVSISGNQATALSVGSAIITASCWYGSEYLTATMNVTVSEVVEVTSISISPSSLTLKVNETYQLSITASPSDASNNVTYTSSDSSVASVSTSGVVTGLKVGSATITATSILFPNISDSIQVEVIANSSLSGTFEKVTTQLDDYNGYYLIVYEESSTSGLVFNPGSSDGVNRTGNYVTLDIEGNTISDENAINYMVNISGSGNGDYDIIYNEDTYLYNSASDSNQIETSETSPSVKHTFTTTSGETLIQCGTSYFRYNASWYGFRYYRASSYSSMASVTLYKFIEDEVEETYTAEDFANDFLNTLVCDPLGIDAPSVDTWNELMDKHSTLDDTNKNILTTYSSDSNDTIGMCVARYDYIINKYSTSTYTDFLNRGSVSNANALAPNTTSNNTTLIICLLVVSILSGAIISTIIIVINKKSNKSKGGNL